MNVGDTIQWRNRTPETVTHVTAEHVIAVDAEGKEHPYHKSTFETESYWTINGKREHVKIDGYYTLSKEGNLRRAADLDDAWSQVDDLRYYDDVVGVVDYGGYGEWWFVNRDGDHDVP